jgi:hypothetical protein
MMFGFGRRDGDQVSLTSQQHLVSTAQQRGAQKGTMRKAGRRGLRESQRKGKSSGNAPHYIDEMNVNETMDGVEVSLDFPPKVESREPPQSAREPVISIKEQIRQRQKIYRTQFSVSFPALKQAPSTTHMSFDNWRPTDHRIPLLGFIIVESSYEDVFNILQHSPVTDEFSAVQKELKQLNSELAALEKDRSWLDANWRKMANVQPNTSPSKSIMSSVVDWDIRRVLNSETLNEDEQLRLQQTRGLCWTIRLQNPKAKEAFLSKCGSIPTKSKNSKRRLPGDTVTLCPDNCRPQGAGASIQHVSIMSGDNGSNSAFFLSRDHGKSLHWGHLPPKLFRRMKEEGMDSGHADLIYLSTGPHGCYYAEFRSGECWWGSAVEDHDFHAIISHWDIYRVVFGPIVAFEDDFGGNKSMSNSWIILGRDGRAAWKNLPSRLHHRLESRLANGAAPAEVALGPGDSYYIRFLDGTVDYCLPAVVAEVCEHIELNGGSITDIALHPEISHDFVIRHTEMRS